MTKNDELRDLFNQNKTPKECVELGYAKPTVYRYLKEYQLEKEKERIKILVDESERIKKVFSGFKENKNLVDMVAEYGISPSSVRELYNEYLKLGEIEGKYQETASKFNETLKKKEDLEAEIKRLSPILDKILAKYNEIFDAWVDTPLTECLDEREEFLELNLSTRLLNVNYSVMEEELRHIKQFKKSYLPNSETHHIGVH